MVGGRSMLKHERTETPKDSLQRMNVSDCKFGVQEADIGN